MQLKTHLKIDQSLNGTIEALRKGYAKVVLHTSSVMAADEEGLVHGGFVFGAADYAAMAAVNDPYVVLGKSEVKFLAPVKVGEDVVLEGTVIEESGNRLTVEVVGKVADKKVFVGTFWTIVLQKHVLSDKK